MAQISENMIKMHSCTFDLEAVRVLCLASLGIRSIMRADAINECKNLRILNLSSNRLTKIGGLDGTKVISLQTLILSDNQISSFADVSSIPSLLHLDLKGNQITSVASLKPLGSKFPSLQSLALQEIASGNSNPVCRIQGYKKEIMETFPFLLVLDGQRVRENGKGQWAVYKSPEDIAKEIEQNKQATGGTSLDVSRYRGEPKEWIQEITTSSNTSSVPTLSTDDFQSTCDSVMDCEKLDQVANDILKAHTAVAGSQG